MYRLEKQINHAAVCRTRMHRSDGSWGLGHVGVNVSFRINTAFRDDNKLGRLFKDCCNHSEKDVRFIACLGSSRDFPADQ